MVHKVKVNGAIKFRFGKNKPTTKEKANTQMRAAFSNGYIPKGGK